jgi:NADPH-dependent glutamate synthase beta subunit-like oxidoreductase
MPELTIDGKSVKVPNGSTVLEAAAASGIDIPAMCSSKGCDASISCMACVVGIEGINRLVPACATAAAEGMRVTSESADVIEARRTAVELLLSDHAGDCEGPCRIACPASMDIPAMIRHIAAGRLEDAIAVIKSNICLPAVLGRICPAPCEKACRRAAHDGAVSICLLKRFAADADLASDRPYVPPPVPGTGARAAVVGAGPAGLAAAYHLLEAGFGCTVFDDRELPGGMLRYGLEPRRLEHGVLDAEIGVIKRMGAVFETSRRIESRDMDRLRKEFDAVIVAAGKVTPERIKELALKPAEGGIATGPANRCTGTDNVFAAGGCARPTRMAVRALADGRKAALAATAFITGGTPVEPKRRFNSRMGRLKEGEMEVFLRNAGSEPPARPEKPGGGFSQKQAKAEASRCLHCDCRKAESCLLRKCAERLDANAKRFQCERAAFACIDDHPQVVYEPGKCIKCGLCIQAAARKGCAGLVFIGRGYEVKPSAAFGGSLKEALGDAALECARICPTGAIALAQK